MNIQYDSSRMDSGKGEATETVERSVVATGRGGGGLNGLSTEDF